MDLIGVSCKIIRQYRFFAKLIDSLASSGVAEVGEAAENNFSKLAMSKMCH